MPSALAVWKWKSFHAFSEQSTRGDEANFISTIDIRRGREKSPCDGSFRPHWFMAPLFTARLFSTTSTTTTCKEICALFFSFLNEGWGNCSSRVRSFSDVIFNVPMTKEEEKETSFTARESSLAVVLFLVFYCPPVVGRDGGRRNGRNCRSWSGGNKRNRRETK